MKNNSKKILIGVVIIVAAVALFCSCMAFLNFIFMSGQTIVEGADKYKGRDAYFSDESEDFNSHLLIFPNDNLDELNITDYYFEYTPLPFQSSYDIYLEYSLEEEEFAEEKQRIEAVSMTYNGQENKVFKLYNISSYEAYIVSCMDGCAYEYALVDEENRKIVCVYSQVDEPEASIVPEEYLLDMELVESEVGRNFSVYYFHEDGNEYVLPELSGDERKSTWYPNN